MIRIAKGFIPNKNLDKKTKELAEKLPKKKPKIERFQDGLEFYKYSFEKLESRVELHDHLRSMTCTFKYGGFRYYVTFAADNGVLNVKLDYILKRNKKRVVPMVTQKVIDEIGEYCETSPIWHQELSEDEHIYTWEFRTNSFFATPNLLYEIRIFFKPPVFKELQVYCVDLGL